MTQLWSRTLVDIRGTTISDILRLAFSSVGWCLVVRLFFTVQNYESSNIYLIFFFPTVCVYTPLSVSFVLCTVPSKNFFNLFVSGFLSTSTCIRAWWCSRLTRRRRNAQRSLWLKPGIPSTSLITPPLRINTSSAALGTALRFRSGQIGSRHANVSLRFLCFQTGHSECWRVRSVLA